MPETRKLAAVMFSDICGYTTMMGKDETVALKVLARNRKIHADLIAKFNGTYIKEIGDGTMATFPSSSEAVACAIEIMTGTTGYDLRIGIHTGEVVMQNSDVFGDDVNIASRVELAAVPGSILISEKVMDNLSNQRQFRTQHIGSYELKNDKQSRDLYAVVAPGLIIPEARDVRAKLAIDKTHETTSRYLTTSLVVVTLIAIGIYFFFPGQKPEGDEIRNTNYTVAVMPFEQKGNNTAPADASFIATGISTQLSGMKGFTTVTTAEVKAGENTILKSGAVPEFSEGFLAENLMATHYLSGRLGEVLDVWLYEVASDSIIWKGEFPTLAPWRTINEVVAHIALELGVQNLNNNTAPLSEMSSQARSIYVDAYSYFQKRSKESNLDTAIWLLQDALELSPNDHDLNSLLALCLATGTERNHYRFDSTGALIFSYANKALAVDSTEELAHVALASYYFRSKDYVKANEHSKTAFELAPHNAITAQSLSEIALYTGNLYEALKYAEQAQKAAPYNPAVRQNYIWCIMANGYSRRAKKEAITAKETFGGDAEDSHDWYLYFDYLISNEYDSAMAMWEPKHDTLRNGFHDLYQGIALVESGDTSSVVRLLSEIDTSGGLGRNVYDHILFLKRMYLGTRVENELAQKQYEKMLETGNFGFGWFIQTYPLQCFQHFRMHPQYQAISKKHGITYTQHPYFMMKAEFEE